MVIQNILPLVSKLKVGSSIVFFGTKSKKLHSYLFILQRDILYMDYLLKEVPKKTDKRKKLKKLKVGTPSKHRPFLSKTNNHHWVVGPGTGTQLLSFWLSNQSDFRLTEGWFSLFECGDLSFFRYSSSQSFQCLYNTVMSGIRNRYYASLHFTTALH